MRTETFPQEDEPWLARAIETLREPVALGPDYLDRTLDALPERAGSSRPRVPGIAWPLAAAATLLVAIGLGRSTQRAPWGGTEPVRFSVAAPAGEVALVGDFNDWNPVANRLQRQGPNWSLTLRLPPGRYRYAYLVDGQRWLPDPGLPAADDDFGTPTSVITVAH